jgi:membrane associated rhomboid family serine protease
MFPYRDDNPTVFAPYVTVGIIILCTLIWLFVQGAGTAPSLEDSICRYGAVAADLTGRLRPGSSIMLGNGLACQVVGGSSWYTLLTSVFMHGGWMHLIGNMWFLWIFGDNIEDSMGHGRYLAFYLICGLVAGLAQVVTDPGAAVPLVGASGAISGVMGAYLVLYPRVRVHLLVYLGFFVTTLAVPAYLMLVYWAALQLLGGLPTLGGVGKGGGTAFMAHVGGFLAGLILIKIFAKPALVAAHRPAIAGAQPDDRW